jgi:hypothetical protein
MSESEIFLEDDTGKFPLLNEFYKKYHKIWAKCKEIWFAIKNLKENCVFQNQLTKLASIWGKK